MTCVLQQPRLKHSNYYYNPKLKHLCNVIYGFKMYPLDVFLKVLK